MKIRIIVIVTVAVGVIAAIIAFKMKGKGGSEAQPLSVRVEPVKRGDLIEIVSAPGQVQPKTKVQISARVAARIVDA